MSKPYISTAGIDAPTLEDAVHALAQEGFTHIELSGAKRISHPWPHNLLELKEKYGLTFNCHNYFFPKEGDYALNLGSLKDSVAMYTVDYYNKALRNCRLLQVNHYGIHAGFYRDIPVERLNKPIKSATLSKTTACLNMFYRRYRDLEKQAKEKNIQLYIENNVLSEDNRCVFYPRVPFMLLHAGDYFAMKEEINAPLLLDIAHLKVTAQSLGLDFVRQLHELWPHAPYIHLSDNDGINDQNLGLSRNSRLYDILKDLPWQGKMVTLEISGDMETVKQSRHIVEELVS